MDAVALARFQFAFTVAYHFFFVPLSIGLGLIMVLFQRRFYKSRSAEDFGMADLWVKIFTATFAIGVATGITMEFSFGTNWASYSRFVGDIFGAPLAAEGLFAFFLESTFLGVLIFGRGKVSNKFYYVSSWLVWLGSLLSALWIIIANSWMQTPAGYTVTGTGAERKAILTNFFAAGFNPSTIPRFLHVINAVLIAGGCMAAAIGAYYLLKGVHKEFGRASISTGLATAAIFSVLILFSGHYQAVEVTDNQPVKMAAMEGHWNDGPMALGLLGYVNESGKSTSALAIPGGVSFLDSFNFSKPLPGLNSFKPTDYPPIQATYQMYHLMNLVFGILLIVTLWLWALNRSGRLEQSPGLLKLVLWFWVVPEFGIQMGWMSAEIGRQPWIVQGLLRTKDAVSAVVPAYQIALTILLFIVIYTVLFVAWARVVLGLIKKGPQPAVAKG
jgi:cytochrome bd ubiquinol oxidase subunit I